jgi:cytochrome c biogenesis protein
MAVDLDMAAEEILRSAQDDNTSSPDVPAGEFFRTIYAFFYSKTVGLIIILALAALILLGALLVQAPAGTYDDPAAKAEFLAEVTAKYGGLAPLLSALGLFHVFSSIGFLVLVGLLAVSILACTTHRLPLLWERWRHPKTHATDRFFAQARYRGAVTAAEPVDDVMATLVEHFGKLRCRVISDEETCHSERSEESVVSDEKILRFAQDDKEGAQDDEERFLYADRFAWGGFGTVVAHLSFIVILAAFVVSALAGVNETRSLPVGGAALAVGHDTGLDLAATSFTATYSDDGRPLDYVSHLVLSRDGVTVAEQDVRVNEPLRYGGYKFHQASYGLAADVRATGPNGVIFEASVPFRWTSTDGTLTIGAFDLEEAGLSVDVVIPSSGASDPDFPAGSAAFQVYKTGSEDVLTMAVVEPGVPMEVGDYAFTFLRERQITGILVRHDPGAPWMWLGSVLIVLGMTVTFACRHRRYWVRVTAGDVTRIELASSDKADAAFRRQFDELVAGLDAVFAPDTDRNQGD